MELNKQRKLLIAVVAIAGGAWAVDRFMLGGAATGPKQASADSFMAPAPAPAPAPRPASAAAPAPAEAAAPSVAQRLARLDREGPGWDGNAFAPPESWLPKEDDGEPVVARDEAVAAAEAFGAAYRLSAVAGRDGTHWSVFLTGGECRSGKTVQMDESVDGFTLVRVSATGATFERDGVQVRLSLPTPGEQEGSQVTVRRARSDNGANQPAGADSAGR